MTLKILFKAHRRHGAVPSNYITVSAGMRLRPAPRRLFDYFGRTISISKFMNQKSIKIKQNRIFILYSALTVNIIITYLSYIVHYCNYFA